MSEQAFTGTTTFMCFWASIGSSYNIVEACDITYERRVVAVVEEREKEENRLLAERICKLLNTRATHPSEAAKRVPEWEAVKNVFGAIDRSLARLTAMEDGLIECVAKAIAVDAWEQKGRPDLKEEPSLKNNYFCSGIDAQKLAKAAIEAMGRYAPKMDEREAAKIAAETYFEKTGGLHGDDTMVEYFLPVIRALAAKGYLRGGE